MALTRLGTKAVENSLTNIVDQGTEGTRVATGTTGQRGTTAGQLRYNSTLGRFEGTTNGSQFVGFATPPTIISISPSILDSAGGETVVITGTNFVAGATTVTLNGQSPSTTTINSTTQITITGTPALSAQTYTDGLSVNASGATATFTFSTSGVPAFTSSAGSLGSFAEGTSVGTLDAGTDIGTSHTVSSGSLPSGVSINSATGAITGTLPSNTNIATFPEGGNGDIISNFTITAIDAESQTSSRAFSITNKQGDPLLGLTYYVFSNAGSPTTNEATNAGTITNNNSSIITSQTSFKKFGTNALYWSGDGNSSHLDIAVPASQSFQNSGSNYMCFEGWGYLETNRGNQTWGSGSYYGNQGFIGVDDTYMAVAIDSTGRVGFYQYNSSNTPVNNGQFPTTGNISTGTWFHFIFQFENNQLRYWKDGTYIGSLNRVANSNQTPNSYRIGGTRGLQSGTHWRGYFDELRLTITGNPNEARISGSSSYTVPTSGVRLFST